MPAFVVPHEIMSVPAPVPPPSRKKANKPSKRKHSDRSGSAMTDDSSPQGSRPPRKKKVQDREKFRLYMRDYRKREKEKFLGFDDSKQKEVLNKKRLQSRIRVRRHRLKTKLQKKGYSEEDIKKELDLLEERMEAGNETSENDPAPSSKKERTKRSKSMDSSTPNQASGSASSVDTTGNSVSAALMSGHGGTGPDDMNGSGKGESSRHLYEQSHASYWVASPHGQGPSGDPAVQYEHAPPPGGPIPFHTMQAGPGMLPPGGSNTDMMGSLSPRFSVAPSSSNNGEDESGVEGDGKINLDGSLEPVTKLEESSKPTSIGDLGILDPPNIVS